MSFGIPSCQGWNPAGPGPWPGSRQPVPVLATPGCYFLYEKNKSENSYRFTKETPLYYNKYSENSYRYIKSKKASNSNNIKMKNRGRTTMTYPDRNEMDHIQHPLYKEAVTGNRQALQEASKEELINLLMELTGKHEERRTLIISEPQQEETKLLDKINELQEKLKAKHAGGRKRVYDEAFHKKVVAVYETGAPYTAIAEQFRISTNTVARIIREANVPKRTRGRKSGKDTYTFSER